MPQMRTGLLGSGMRTGGGRGCACFQQAGAESAASERTSESFGHGRQSAADSVLSSLRSLRTRVSTVASEALTVDEAADGGGPSKEARARGVLPFHAMRCRGPGKAWGIRG
eukprot:6209103-Pleurochrysis_carterae.AAC.2